MKFSIVIPIAPNRDAEVVESLKKIDYPKDDYEIIIEKGTNTSENRNNGVKKAKFDTILFLDDDAYLEKDLLKNINSFLEDNSDVDIVGGVQLTPKDDTRFGKVSGVALSSFFGAYKMSNRYLGNKINLNASEKDLTSAICVVKKRVFNKIGGFDKKYFPGEDPEFFTRAKENGFKIASDPNIKIYHKRRPTLSSLFILIYLYCLVRPKITICSMDPVFAIPSMFLVYLVLLPFLVFVNKLFLIPLLLYVVIALLFSFYESIKNKKALFLLPFLYLTIHLAYGLGFIVGLVND